MEPKKGAITEAQMRTFAMAHFDAWNAHDVDACLALVTDDVVWGDPSFDKPAQGKAEMADRLRSLFAAFPDIHFPEDKAHVHTNVKDGECVLTWMFTATMTGPHVAPEGRMPATGKRIEVSGATLNRFRGDKLSHFTMYYDTLGMMQQLGLLPEASGLGFKAVVLADFLAGKAKKVLHMA
jgi:steroid delta-isomerase-like uncharacterized protein